MNITRRPPQGLSRSLRPSQTLGIRLPRVLMREGLETSPLGIKATEKVIMSQDEMIYNYNLETLKREGTRGVG